MCCTLPLTAAADVVSDGYYESYGLNYTLPLAKRFYDKGYKIYLDYRKLSSASGS